jgi:hypothetical protein
MAELYLARTVGMEGFEKLVCVKRILPQYANNPSFVNMFLNEARLAATLHHPNIAQVYDIGQEQGEYFFAMEYVHGEDLGRLVATAQESGVPISLDCALTLLGAMRRAPPRPRAAPRAAAQRRPPRRIAVERLSATTARQNWSTSGSHARHGPGRRGWAEGKGRVHVAEQCRGNGDARSAQRPVLRRHDPSS